jgi:hypothetical protein
VRLLEKSKPLLPCLLEPLEMESRV